MNPRLVGRLRDSNLFIAVVHDVRDWPEEIQQPPPCFVLLTALESGDASSEELTEFAVKLLDQGCGDAVCWGSDADRMKFAFDMAFIGREERGGSPCGFVGSTSAFQPLDEALWHAMFAAWPDAWNTEGAAESVLVVTQPRWAETIEARLSDPEQLSRDFVGDEDDA